MASSGNDKELQSVSTLVHHSVLDLKSEDSGHHGAPSEKNDLFTSHETLPPSTDGREPSNDNKFEADATDSVHLENATPVKRTSVEIPRSRRRGLFARFAVVPEITEPTHYSTKTKWIVTFVVSIAAAAAPVGSAIIFRKFFREIPKKKPNTQQPFWTELSKISRLRLR